MTGWPASLSFAQRGRVGAVVERDVQEDAVVAVVVGVEQRLVGDRQDAAAVLAGGLGDELLGPDAVGAQRVVGDERELVAAGLGQLAERDAEPQAGVALLALAFLLGADRAVEDGGDVVARHHGRDEPERAERAVAAADVRVAVERAAEALLVRERLQARAGVGDRDEVRAVDVGAERLVHRHRLDRPARLARHDRDRLAQVELVEVLLDLFGVRRVQHVQREAGVGLPEGEPEHLGRKARSTHAEHDGVGVALVEELVSESLVLRELLLRALRDVQPAEPVGDLRRALRCPQRPVLAPDAADHILVGGAT